VKRDKAAEAARLISSLMTKMQQESDAAIQRSFQDKLNAQ
jgi:hypothetical protein